MKRKTGFTLVELLIVIALISILSVAVLATINPIEQANKAKDSTVQNDAAEVLNAYERYYANSQSYPWMQFTDTPALDVEDEVLYRSDEAGFGICYTATTGASTATGECNTTGDNLGLLISSDELKASFVGKSEFQSVDTNDENGLWVYKAPGSGGSIYVCYIPKAKSNRQLTDKLYCINGNAAALAINKVGLNGCAALSSTSSDAWAEPQDALDSGTDAIFRCVPE